MSCRRLLLAIMLLAGTVTLAGCGTDGGAATQTRKVTGYASKGIIAAGVVTAYGISPGGNKILPALAQTSTDNSGFYTMSVGSYYGPLVIEVTGNYQDEATKQTATIEATAPLTAALVPPADATPLQVNVTALTKIAFDLAQSQPGSFTTSINATNQEVASSFQVPDILSTRPLNASTALPATASPGEIRYTLVLAAVSQVAANNLPTGTTTPSAQQLATALSGALTTLAEQMPATGTGTATTLQETVATAATQFINNPAANDTGLKPGDPAVQPILSAARRTVTITVAVRNADPSVPAFGAVHGSITVPAGLTCPSDPVTGELPSSAITALQAGAMVSGNFKVATSVLTLEAIRAEDLALGDLLSVTCSAPSSMNLDIGGFVLNNASLDVNDGGYSLLGFGMEVSALQ